MRLDATMDDVAEQEILTALEEHEEAIAALYASFGARLPAMREMWDRLVLEEKAHADVIRTLRQKREALGLLLNRRRFNLSATQTSIAYIHRQMEKIASEPLTALRALALAVDVEQAMLEKEFFLVFESDSAEMKKEFQALLTHTVGHRKRLERALASEREKGND